MEPCRTQQVTSIMSDILRLNKTNRDLLSHHITVTPLIKCDK